MDQKHEIVFLDMAVYVDEKRKVSSKLRQKPRDTGTILNFRSCDPLQLQGNIVEDTIQRLSLYKQLLLLRRSPKINERRVVVRHC